jgi:beta-lactamase class D
MNKFIPYILLLMTFNVFGQKTDTLDLKSYFGGFSGGFAVYTLKTGKWYRYNPEQCKKRLSPCSTFKIPNSLIGLETGVIRDTGYIIKYDSVMHPKNADMLKKEPFKYWYQDLSLKNAFKYSCVWYYQELARRVGKNRMEKYVRSIDYGNNDLSSGIDTFWLCGSIQISINEQIEFLRKLYTNKINGISEKTINEVKSIMLYESKPHYKLYGKTGAGDCINNMVLGWYIGFVETDSGVHLFAMNIIVNSFDDLKNNLRIEMTKKILEKIGILSRFWSYNTHQNISRNVIENIISPSPPLPEQHAIASFLDRETAKLDVPISKIEFAIPTLKEYRTSIISATVTGKIDVRKEIGS